MSKHEEANLILKLYELRRDPVMRQAREWYFLEFHPDTFADLESTMMGPHSGHLRMVFSFWDMAAALVKHGAISRDLLNDTNGEHFMVYAKLEPFLTEMRAAYNPQMLRNLEELMNDTPGSRERIEGARNQVKTVRAALAKQRAAASKA